MRQIRLIGPIVIIFFLVVSAFADTMTLSAPVAVAAGGEPWLVVAASDTPKTLKDRADYKCDGTADEKEINEALSAAGAVKLCPGIFVVSGSITMPSNTMLMGSGPGTIIKGAIKIMTNVTGASNIFITNLRLDGNNKAGEGYGIYFEGVGSDTEIGCKIENIQAENFSKGGIYLKTVKNSFINDNVCKDNDGEGIHFVGADSSIVAANLVKNNRSGIVLLGGSYNIISDNICAAQTIGYGIGLASPNTTYNIVSNNICQENSIDGIRLTQAKYNNIVSNVCKENYNHGIGVWSFSGKGSDNNAIIANSCVGNSKNANGFCNDIYIAGSSYNDVQGNTCRAGTGSKKPKHGILVEKYAGVESQKNLVTNNDCYQNSDFASGVAFSDAGTGTVTAPGNRQ